MTAKAVRVAPIAVVLSLMATLCAAAESSALIERAKLARGARDGRDDAGAGNVWVRTRRRL